MPDADTLAYSKGDTTGTSNGVATANPDGTVAFTHDDNEPYRDL